MEKLLDIINEQGAAARELEGAFKELKGAEKAALEGLFRNPKIAKNLVRTDGSAIRNIGELEDALKKGNVAEGPLGTIRRNLLRNPATTPELRSKLIDNLTNNPNILKKYENSTQEQIKDALTKIKNPYTPEQAEEIAASIVKKRTGAGAAEDIKGEVPAGEAGATQQTATGTQGPVFQIKGEGNAVINVNYTMAASATEGAANIEKAVAKGETKEFTEAMKKNAEATKNIKSNAWNKIKKVRNTLGVIWLVKWGLIVAAVGGGYALIKYALIKHALKGSKDPNSALNPMPACLLELLDKEGCTLETTPDGTPVVAIIKTGNPDYDKAGGLKFYIEGNVVTTGDGKRKGKWACKGGEVTTTAAPEAVQENMILGDIFESILLKEELLLIEQDLRASRVDRIVRRVTRRLKGDIGRRDLQTVYRILNRIKDAKYEGQDAIGLIKQDYTRLHGRDLIADIQSVTKGLDQRGLAARKNLLALLQSKTTQPVTEPGGATTGGGGGDPLSNITITWDDGGTTPGGGGGGGKYSWCEAMPFKFGCHNDRIREIQLCIGLPEKYQTGNFGPITAAKLKEVGYDLSGGITEDIYKDVLARCNKFGKTEAPAAAVEPQREKPIEKIPALHAPKLDTGLRASTQPPIERQKAIVSNVRRDKKYVGPPLNDAETKWLNAWMAKLGNTDVEKAKEKILYGR